MVGGLEATPGATSDVRRQVATPFPVPSHQSGNRSAAHFEARSRLFVGRARQHRLHDATTQVLGQRSGHGDLLSAEISRFHGGIHTDGQRCELQPVERVWTLLNEPIANRTFRDLDELQDVAVHRCRQLAANNDLIRRHTCFYWWKEAL